MGSHLSTSRELASQLLTYLDPHEKTGRVILPIVILFGTSVFISSLNNARSRYSLNAKRRAKQQARKRALAILQEKLDKIQDLESLKSVIGQLPLSDLVKQLESRKIKAIDVLAVFQAKALDSHRLTNCLVEPIIEADRQAVEADLNPKGPFYGLPISVKDNYGCQGYDSTIGCTQWAFRPWQEDSVMIKVLKKQGAIPFVKTNVPQTMLSFGCGNPIYGHTVNPYDKERGPGGSSGGEAALIASGGSLIGIGSDIGGSIRIPANMCGICGFKPTEGRLSNEGTHPKGRGQTVVKPSYGPLAQDVDSIVMFMKNVLVPYMFELDPTIPPLPFKTEVYETKRPLRIGYYTQDGYILAVPAMERGVMETKAKLEKAGHTLVPWQPPGCAEGLAARYFVNSVMGDGAQSLIEITKHDKLDKSMMLMIFLAKHRLIKKYIVDPLIYLLDRKLSEGAQLGYNSVFEWWHHTAAVQMYRQRVIVDLKEKGIDAVICPGFAFPAIPVDAPGKTIPGVSYTALYNLLNFPAGSIPVTKVTQEDEDQMKSYKPSGIAEYFIKKTMVGSVGLPVNVQCITLPWEDELCLRIMKEIEMTMKE